MNNLTKIRAAMAAQGMDAVLLTSEVNRQYAAGYNVAEGVEIISAAGARYDEYRSVNRGDRPELFRVQLLFECIKINDHR